MQSPGWVALLQRIPPTHHDNLMLMTTNGIEMSILNLIRIEEDYLVMRGRMSGSDAGRILFMPFDRITYIGFQRSMKEAEVRAMYDEALPAPAPVAESQPEPAAPPPPAVPADAAPPPPPPPPPPDPPAAAPAPPRSRSKIPLPDKNAMLERMRARSQAGMLKSPANP